MIRIHLRVDGIADTVSSLRRLKKALSSFEPELKDIGKYLLEFFSDDVFETQGSVLGESWPRLKNSTLVSKQKLFPGTGTLQRTGNLRGGLELQTTARYALLNNPIAYAKYHHHGTYSIPKRILIKVTKAKERELQDMFKKHLLFRIEREVKI